MSSTTLPVAWWMGEVASGCTMEHVRPLKELRYIAMVTWTVTHRCTFLKDESWKWSVASLWRSATSRPTNGLKGYTVHVGMQVDVVVICIIWKRVMEMVRMYMEGVKSALLCENSCICIHRELNGTLRGYMRLVSLSKVLENRPIHSLRCSA